VPRGPAGLAVEVVDGPMDGLLLCGGFDALQIGRVARNPAELFLELYLDASVSSRHAVLSRSDDPRVWRIEDRDSTNGTLVADEDVRGTGPRPIPLGTAFMVGHSVLRCSAAAGEETFAPGAEELQAQSARLLGLLAPEAGQGYGAAVALAIAEQRPFLTDRHLFLGLAAMNPELPLFAGGGGPLGSRFLGDVLWRDEYWTRGEAWIHRRLRASSIGVQVLSKDDIVLTPRLLRLLLAAEGEAGAAAAERIRPADLLRAFLAGPVNRPRELLEREKVSPSALLARLGAAPAPAPPPAATVTPPAGAPGIGVPVPEAATTGDPALDARAQDTARRLYGVTALYHLAEAGDRQEVMKQLLRQELAQVPAEGRPRLLRQLRRLFPLAPSAAIKASEAAAVAAVEPPRSDRSDRSPAGGKTPAPRDLALVAPSPPIPWNTLLGGARQPDLSAVDPRDRGAASLAADVFAFALAIERFIVSVVQNVRSPGLVTGQLQLPGYPTSIKRFTNDVTTGKELRREELGEYLSAVEMWLVATVMAYHEGPDLWFKDFWRKVSPAALEDAKGGMGLLSGAWNRYKERVKTVTPDLVSDQIQQIVRQRANEQYQQLFERRKPS
jgi:hypothetical protein